MDGDLKELHRDVLRRAARDVENAQARQSSPTEKLLERREYRGGEIRIRVDVARQSA